MGVTPLWRLPNLGAVKGANVTMRSRFRLYLFLGRQKKTTQKKDTASIPNAKQCQIKVISKQKASHRFQKFLDHPKL